MSTLETIQNQMIEACRQLDTRAFVANHDGNLSARIEEDLFLVTPTAFAKRAITTEDLLLIDSSGKVVKGRHKVFSEWKWHLAIYKTNPLVSAVCHAHPPYCMAWGLTGQNFGFQAVPESLVSLGGPIQLVPLPSPSTTPHEMEREIRFALESAYAFLVQGNGAFAVGDNPEMSYLRVEVLEQVVKAQTIARQVGVVQPLSHTLAKELIEKRPPLKPQYLSSIQPVAGMAPEVQDLKAVIRREIESLLQAQK